MENNSLAQIEQVLKIGKQILAEPDLDQVLISSMDHLVEVSGAERGLIILYNADGESHIQTARNLDKKDINHPEFEISQTIIERVKSTGEPVYLKNAFEEKDLDKSRSVRNLKIISIICLPLKYNKHVFGVIYLGNRSILGRFTTETNELVESFADFISLAAYHAMERNNWKKKQETLEEELRLRYNFDSIIGTSPKMIKVLELISQVADTEATVLIEGETGTGKELVVRAIHYNSGRKEQGFISLNCGAFPENLLESEFFGHEKGAFTGAFKTKKGKFELADNGTLFLDEVDEMSPALQAKLLRVIQFGEFSPVGSEKVKKCDVRIVAASKSGLKKLVELGKFREDLYYRLNLFLIKIPPLRERGEDVLTLAEYFLIQTCKQLNKVELKFNFPVKKALQNYDYPGNVRELENIVHRSAILCRSKTITPEHLPEEMRSEDSNHEVSKLTSLTFKEAKEKVISDFERNFIIQMLEENKGNISKTANQMGMHKKNLHEKLNKYNIKPTNK